MMAEQAPTLHISALGPPRVSLGENLVTFPTRKTLALLIYLAAEGNMQPRERLAALLWPEAPPERCFASLRNTLAHLQGALRQASGEVQPAYLSVSHNELGLNWDDEIDCDLHTIARAYGRARSDRVSRPLPAGSDSLLLLQSAAACQRGGFLAGFSLGDAPAFDDWVALQRELWHRRLGLVLDRLSEIQFASGEFAGVTETASHWIALDGLNEIAYRRKMRAHFAAGERGQALETFEVCRAALAAELGIEPEPDTAALAERIRTQVSPAARRSRRAEHRPRPLETSVAFLGGLFAGRSSEHQALVSCYQRAAAGQPQLVVLRGEAGIGKTRLARRFMAWAGARGAELLQGGAFESGSHLPFQPLVQALRQRLAVDHSPTDALDPVWLSPLSRLLPELRARYPDLPRLIEENDAAGAAGSQARIFEPLVQLTLVLARRAPLALFVDDLHWTDSTTLDLLHYAIRRWQESGTRVLFLASLRSEALHPMAQPQQAAGPHGLSRWLARVERDLAPVHVELEPLGEGETVQMILSILAPPAADLAQWLYDETRGHPFYLIETLKDLVERRALHPQRWAEGQWTFAVDSQHDLGQAVRVPSTVHAVIRSRLNRLSPNAFSLLAGAAVLEQQITFERLCTSANLVQDLALPALDELISSRLLLEPAQPGGAYVFTNDMLRDVVYTEAGDARRRLYHRRALETLAAAGDSAAVLAHHALAAGLAQAAFRHSLAAGWDALRISAVSESVVHVERALRLVREGLQPEAPEEADLRELAGQLGLDPL